MGEPEPVPEKPNLTGKDYMTQDTLVLQSHKDYSAHAHRVVKAIANMTTNQLEELTIAKGYLAHGR